MSLNLLLSNTFTLCRPMEFFIMIVTVKLGWAIVFIKSPEVNCLNLIVVLSQNIIFV